MIFRRKNRRSDDLMHWLNYHHLMYFWTVARTGSVTAAAEELHLSRPAVTEQIRSLERSLGNKLFQQAGRRLVLTDFGQRVLIYADEIFTTGQELQRVVRGGHGETQRLVVGVPDELPKLVVFRLLQPAFNLKERPRLVCREGKRDDLLADLALHRLDLLVSDAPIEASMNVRAYNHRLGECGISFFSRPADTSRLRRGFPGSLNGQPALLPSASTTTRRLLDRWFEECCVQPQIMAEFDDSALMKVFGQAGMGVFPAPTIIEDEVIRQYRVKVIGRLESVREQFFAISVERRLKHPAVVAITAAARHDLF
jgi:LysR family transcriptional activator of nhaA